MGALQMSLIGFSITEIAARLYGKSHDYIADCCLENDLTGEDCARILGMLYHLETFIENNPDIPIGRALLEKPIDPQVDRPFPTAVPLAPIPTGFFTSARVYEPPSLEFDDWIVWYEQVFGRVED
jgi:hypothetical protein